MIRRLRTFISLRKYSTDFTAISPILLWAHYWILAIFWPVKNFDLLRRRKFCEIAGFNCFYCFESRFYQIIFICPKSKRVVSSFRLREQVRLVKGATRLTLFAAAATKSASTSKRRPVLLVDSLDLVCVDTDGVSRPVGAVQPALAAWGTWRLSAGSSATDSVKAHRLFHTRSVIKSMI